MINLDIVQIYDNKDVMRFSNNVINIVLKTGQSIIESKRHSHT